MPHQLDDRAFVTRLDPKDMLGRTERFPDQCREALGISQGVSLKPMAQRPSVVMLTGMGGSAAGGDFARSLFENKAAVPFIVNRDYHLPTYVGLGDYVFCASYSGNTEETLSAYADAKKAGAQIIAVTSGGKLAELARADGFPTYIIPGGHPPRTALGYMLIPILVASEALGLLPSHDFAKCFALLDQCSADWTVGTPFESNPTKQLAQAMFGKVALLYGLGQWQGAIANRWKGQINENAKNLAFPNTYPELNHNEVLGWVGAGKQGVANWLMITLVDGTESAKMKTRSSVTEKLVKGTAEAHHVTARGEDLLEKMLSLTFYGDFVSIYLAALNGIDPENIDSINTLKEELGKVEG
ncbi:MAG: bifunctional phosphoglucose/phosphomannose isomerase [Chlorobia bacterium]|nr:bifunctional phosphoglucose/phosphomannose isomerase [Fimbriimonadaceae bacterium]